MERVGAGLLKVAGRGAVHLVGDALRVGAGVGSHAAGVFGGARAGGGGDRGDPRGSNDEQSVGTEDLQRMWVRPGELGVSELPSSRVGRVTTFAGLAFSLATSPGSRQDVLTAYLCRLRGGALKLGQMLSIQGESVLPKEWSQALERVRQAADAMPRSDLELIMAEEWGEGWRDKVNGGGFDGVVSQGGSLFDPDCTVVGEKLVEFDDKPIAAASIGQVHLGTLSNGEWVAIKVQYPDILPSITSDLDNLQMLVSYLNIVPKGVFIDQIISAGRAELGQECDYSNEIRSQERLRSLVSSDRKLVELGFAVPRVVPALSTERVITTEFAYGSAIDKAVNAPQSVRDRIGLGLLRLTLLELFVWKFMQTDPNFSNFIYDDARDLVQLIDFGSAREFDKDFVDGYLDIVWAAAVGDEETLMQKSFDHGFLAGGEGQTMLDAHLKAGLILGEPFRDGGTYDFGGSDITERIGVQARVFSKHRIQPPPTEVYTLHRKLAGAFLMCIKLGARVDCRGVLDEIREMNYSMR